MCPKQGFPNEYEDDVFYVASPSAPLQPTAVRCCSDTPRTQALPLILLCRTRERPGLSLCRACGAWVVACRRAQWLTFIFSRGGTRGSRIASEYRRKLLATCSIRLGRLPVATRDCDLDERKNPEQFPHITCKRESHKPGDGRLGKRIAARRSRSNGGGDAGSCFEALRRTR
jgi:hypothetical protein